MKMPGRLTVVIMSTLCLCSLVDSKDQEFDHFVYAQEWPVSACIDAESEHTCKIPEEVKTWTVHGLWPTRKEEEGPSDCNSTWAFNYTQIQSLQEKLSAHWPNLYTDTPMTSFWSHEWSKHGTCSTTVKATSNEYLYFLKGLELNTYLDLGGMLEKMGITPDSSTGYKVENVRDLLNMYYRTNVTLSCTYNKKVHQQLLLQVEICLNKDFQTIHCHPINRVQQGPLRGEECRTSELVYILPIRDHHLYFQPLHPKIIPAFQ